MNKKDVKDYLKSKGVSITNQLLLSLVGLGGKELDMIIKAANALKPMVESKETTMKTYKEITEKADPTEALTEGYTWEIVGEIGKDGKAAGIVVYYDEQADMYQLIQGGFKNKGIQFTASQYKAMGFAMKGK